MSPPNPATRASENDRSLLVDPLASDQIWQLKFGTESDRHSLSALYRSDGRDDGVTRPNPELEGFLAVVVLQDLNEFTLMRNGKPLLVGPARQGAFGIHDLRNSFSSGKYPVFSLSMVFSSAFLDDLKPYRGFRGRDLLHDRLDYGHRDDTLLHLALTLLPSFRKPEESSRLFVDQVFLAASTYLIEKYGVRRPMPVNKGRLSLHQERTAKDFLMAGLDANVSLEEVANACGLSPPYFARLFKQTTGVAPYRWLIDRRLERAKDLLESTDELLPQIALSCGFADQSHFTRTFSRLMGVSPGAFRRTRRS